jgi:MFS superfamily sulfate permease-like transporter
VPERAWGFKSPLRHAPSTWNRDSNGDKVPLGIEHQLEAQLVIELGLLLLVDIPSGLPSFAWPGVGLDDVAHLLPAALGIFAVGYADRILTARSFAGRHRQHVDANQELVAMGGQPGC